MGSYWGEWALDPSVPMRRGEDTDPQRGHRMKMGETPRRDLRLPPTREGRFHPPLPPLPGPSLVTAALGSSLTWWAVDGGWGLGAADSRSPLKTEQSGLLLARIRSSAPGLPRLDPARSASSWVHLLSSKTRCLFPPTACAPGPTGSTFPLSPGFQIGRMRLYCFPKHLTAPCTLPPLQTFLYFTQEDSEPRQ